MSIAEFSIRNRLIAAIVILGSLLGGWIAYEKMPRFEDPEFTIRTVEVFTQYPGATPEEVANEVSEVLESEFQQMQEVEEVRSVSTDGLSRLSIDIKFDFSPDKDSLQLIYTKIRNRARDAARQLPPGASDPIVNDDFADVYGLYYVLTSDGFSPREMHEYAKNLRRALLTVDGVGKVSIQGALSEAIYIEFSQEQIAAAGTSVDQIFNQLSKHSSVAAAGEASLDGRRLTIQLPPTTETITALENTIVSVGNDGRVLRLRDMASVTRGYQDPPQQLMRYNGLPALGIGVSAVSGENIVRVGGLVNARLAELESERPIGLELETYYDQAGIVDLSVKDFAVNVAMALAIVLVTLGIFMGIGPAVVIGGVLVLTIAATLTVMYLWGVPMHRISLGALIIALGMLVDNAIVVTEGILIGVKAGKKKLDVAIDIVAKTKWPLLGGTIVGIIAFAPIGFAPGATAEFTGDLFWVIFISLSFSWIFAITAVPLFADILFKESKGEVEVKPEGVFMRGYKAFMVAVLRLKYLVLAGAVGAFVLAIMGFAYVIPGFFPASTSPQIVVDYRLPEGADIQQTDADIQVIEDFVGGLENVSDVHALVGSGTLRFMLVYAPESANAAYGQLLIKVSEYEAIDHLIPEIQTWLDQNMPDSQAKVWRFQLGPGGGSKIEAEFHGPDPKVLHELAAEATAIMAANPDAISVKTDWYNPVPVIEPVINEVRARRLGITREDIANAINISFSGRTMGTFRDGDTLIPIIQRAPERERRGIDSMGSIQIASQVTGATVPLDQLVDGYRTIWRDAMEIRVNRVPVITAQSDPASGVLAGDLQKALQADIEAIELPAGYSMKWSGEFGDSADANADLASTIPMGFAAMVLTVVLLFNAIRQPVLIFLTMPLSIIGVVIGLLVMGVPMEFMAILGVLSLSGLLIKNAIVLVDQMDLEIGEGMPRFDAVVDSAASRVRPVMMGSLTTVLGVLPLLGDAFFKSMAVVLIFGLSFATLLTLIVVPVLYVIFFRIKATERAGA